MSTQLSYPPGVTDADIDAHHGAQPLDPDSPEALYERESLELADAMKGIQAKISELTGRLMAGGTVYAWELENLGERQARAYERFVKFKDEWNQFL